MRFGLLIADFVGALQADHSAQGRGKPVLQPQSRISRVVPAILAGVVVVGALHGECAEEALHVYGGGAFAHFSRFRLVGRVNPVGRRLQQEGDQGRHRLENGGANQAL